MLSYLLAGSAIGPVVSQSLLDISTSLLFIFFIVHWVRNNSKAGVNFRKPYLFEYGFIFYFLAIVTGFVILKITDAKAWLILGKFTWVINFYLFSWTFTKYEITLTKMLKFFSLAYAIPNIYNIVCALVGYDPIRKLYFEKFRLLGILNSATYTAHISGLLFIFFLVILYFQFKNLSQFYKWMATASGLITGFAIFLTFTRGVWASLALTILIFLYIHNKKIFKAAIIIGPILCVTLYFFSDSFQSRVQQSLQTRKGDQERWALFDVHLKLVTESPIVGIGYASPLSHTPPELFAKYGYKTYINSHAHNQILNVLTTTGVLGLIPFLIFYFWFLVTNIRLVKKFTAEKNRDYLIMTTACLYTQVEFFIANLTDVGFEYAKIRSLILLVWALVFCIWRNKLNLKPEPTTQVSP